FSRESCYACSRKTVGCPVTQLESKISGRKGYLLCLKTDSLSAAALSKPRCSTLKRDSAKGRLCAWASVMFPTCPQFQRRLCRWTRQSASAGCRVDGSLRFTVQKVPAKQRSRCT